MAERLCRSLCVCAPFNAAAADFVPVAAPVTVFGFHKRNGERWKNRKTENSLDMGRAVVK